MIVSISGASCTGKDTLINALAKMGYPVITPSASRAISERTYPSEDAKNLAIYAEMMRQLNQAREIYNKTGKHVFLNRSFIDMLSFSHTLKLPEAMWEKEAREQCWRIHLVVVCSPNEVSFQADGVRPEDQALRSNWHYQILKDCDNCGLRYIVAQGTVPERIALIDKVLRESTSV